MVFRGQDRFMNPRGSHYNFRGRGGIQRGFNRGGMTGPRVAVPIQFQNRVYYPDNNFGNRGGGNFNRPDRAGPGPASKFVVESGPPNTDGSRERERDFDMRSSVQMDSHSVSPTASRDYMAKSNRNISRPSGSGSRFSPDRVDEDAGRSRDRTREPFRSSQDHRQSPQNISEKPVRKPPPAPRFIVGSSKNVSDKSERHNLERDFSPDSRGRRANNLLDDNTFATPRPIEQNFNRIQEKRRDSAYRDQDVHRMETFHDSDERIFSTAAQRRNDNIADGHKVSPMSKFSPELIRGGKFSSDRTHQHAADRDRDDYENTDHRKSTTINRNTSVKSNRPTSPEFFMKPSNKTNSPRSSVLQRKNNISIERCFFDESGEEISAEQIIPGEDLQKGKLFHGRTSGPGKLAEHNISWADIARKIGFPARNDDRQPLPESSRFSSGQKQGNSAGSPMKAETNKGRDRSNGRDFQRPNPVGRQESPVGRSNSNVRRRSLSPADIIRSNMRFKGRNAIVSDVPVVVPEPPVIGNISSQPESSSSRFSSNEENIRRGLRVIDIDLMRNRNRDRSRSPIRSSRGSDFLVESSKNIKRTIPRDISPDLTKRRRDTTFGARNLISSRRFSVDSIRPDSPVRQFSPDPPKRVENNFANRNSGRDSFQNAKRETVPNFKSFNLAPDLPGTKYVSPHNHEKFHNDDHIPNLSIPARLTERDVETFEQFSSANKVFPDMSQANENNFAKSKRSVYRTKGYTNEDRERVMGELNSAKQFINPNQSNFDIFPGNRAEVFNNPIPTPTRGNNATRNVSFGNLITVIPNAKINFKNRVNNPITDHNFPDSNRKNENISNNKSTNSNLRSAENISFLDIPSEENEIPFDIPSFASKFYPKRNVKPNPEFSDNRAFEEDKIPLQFSQNREMQQRDQKMSSRKFSPERSKKPNPDYFGIGNFDESLPSTTRFSSNRERERSPSPRRNQDFNDFKAPPKVFTKVENPIDKIKEPRKRLSGAQRRRQYKEKLRRSAEPENTIEVEPEVLDETEKEILAAKERVMRLDQNYNKLLNKIKESGQERNVSPKRRSRSTSRERYAKVHLRGTKMERRKSLNQLDEKEDLRDFITSLSTSKERYGKVNNMEKRIPSSQIDEKPYLRDLKIDILNRNHPVGKMSLLEKITFDEKLDIEIGLTRMYNNLFIPEFTKSDLIGGIFRMNAINNKSVEWLRNNIYKFKNIWPNADPRITDKMSCKYYQKISIEVPGYEVSFLEDICRRLMIENPTIHTGLWKRLEKYTTGPTEKIVLLVDPESIEDIKKLGRVLKYENKFIHVIICDEYLSSKRQYDDHALRGEYPLESRSRHYY